MLLKDYKYIDFRPTKVVLKNTLLLTRAGAFSKHTQKNVFNVLITMEITYVCPSVLIMSPKGTPK